MKQFCTIMLSLFFLLYSCAQSDEDRTRSFISGTYLKKIHQEFSIGIDSLIIKEMEPNSNTFYVCRNSVYQQKVNGKLLLPKREAHKWKAVYDSGTKELVIQNKERTITFLPDQNRLVMGSTEYIKIK